MNTSSSATDMTRSAARHFSGVSLNGALVVALVGVALGGIVLLSGLGTVFSSAFAGSIGEQQPADVLEGHMATHRQQMEEYKTRFNERYAFFDPPPRPRPQPQQPVRAAPPPPPPPTEPTTPPTYTGPSIAWVIGDDVYFNMAVPTLTDKYQRIRLGEEKNGLKVIGLEKMPRYVSVAHQGGEYDVKVFGDSTLYSTLFPERPVPSVLIPGMIPEVQSAPAPIIEAAPAAAPVSPAPGSGEGRAAAAEAARRRAAEERGEAPKPAEPQDAEPVEDEEPDDDEGEGDPEQQQQEQEQEQETPEQPGDGDAPRRDKTPDQQQPPQSPKDSRAR